MMHITSPSESGLDLEKAKKQVSAYSRATGAECFIIDSTGNSLFESCFASHLCQVCSKLQSAAPHGPRCASVHLYGSYQAERFDGKYVYFCPVGLVFWASPLTPGNTFRGALIGGPVLMVDPEEFLLDDLIKKSGIAERQLQMLHQYIERVPVIQPDIVNSLSELLLIVASGLSADHSGGRPDQRLAYEIQAQISETVHHIKQLKDGENEKWNYPFEKEKELVAKIALGDKPSAQKILNEILGYVFFSSGKDFEVMKARVLELVVILSRAAVEGGADSAEIFGLNYKYLSDIHQFDTVEELTFWLSTIMARFTDCVFNLADVRHKDTIFKAVDYIKRNFTTRITLEEVARHVYLNPSYFSKIFKNEMKCTFVSYVNQIRVNASKNLLLDISISLTDVSSMVGFEDQSYFTKVFKHATGVTPGKFRESRGQATV
jgi:two-component system response regulator YesN